MHILPLTDMPWWLRARRGDALSSAERDAIWALMSRHASKDRAGFEATLRTCEQVYLLRDGEQVTGLVCFGEYDEVLEGRPVTALYGHWYVLDAAARGSGATAIASLRAVVEVKRRAPLRPVFGLAKCSTLNSYKMTVRGVPHVHPTWRAPSGTA